MLGNDDPLTNLVPSSSDAAFAICQAAFVFDGTGTITAGNSSSLNDAASAVLVMSREEAEALGIKPKLTVSIRAIRMETVFSNVPGRHTFYRYQILRVRVSGRKRACCSCSRPFFDYLSQRR